MRIIEATAVVDYNLAIEIFNLMEEQQLRIHTLLEERNLINNIGTL